MHNVSTFYTRETRNPREMIFREEREQRRVASYEGMTYGGGAGEGMVDAKS